MQLKERTNEMTSSTECGLFFSINKSTSLYFNTYCGESKIKNCPKQSFREISCIGGKRFIAFES